VARVGDGVSELAAQPLIERAPLVIGGAFTAPVGAYLVKFGEIRRKNA
jgi:hypothetical protein